MIFILFILSGCSPFGNSSIIESINNEIKEIFSVQSSEQINSGGSQTLVSSPASGQPSDLHRVSLSVGTTLQQTSYVTSQGNTVEVVVSGVQ